MRTLIFFRNFFLFFLIINIKVFAQDNFLEQLMVKSGKFEEILSKKDTYEVQILYTQIDRDRKNKPKFTSFQYGLDKNRYFYPASTVKFPSAVLALEKINQLNISNLTKESKMITGSEFKKHTSVLSDSTSEELYPSVAHYIKKILLVSDNDAYNRLYEFLGQDELNNGMKKRGIENSQIFHRLSVGMNLEENKRTNPIKFYKNNQIVYEQPMINSSGKYASELPILKGKGFYKGDTLINKPFDFYDKNDFPIEDQQAFLKRVLFPESYKKSKRFDLTKSDYEFLYQFMSQYPSETNFPKYDTTENYQSFCKFLIFGDSKNPIPKNIRIFNKVGDAYGFLIDNAYVVDFDNNVEFLVTAVISCNSDGIFNDDKYDYDSIGFPFFANLGKEIYQQELKRIKKNKPDLSKFKLKYEVRK